MKLDKIVTHSGKAHRDETLAIAILITKCENNPTIYRQNPSKKDIESDSVAVIDIGAKYDPNNLNFDHHQFPKDYQPTCSLTLILDYFDLLEQARVLWPWLIATEIYDSKGPRQFRDFIQLDPKHSPKIASPIEEGFLRAIKESTVINPGDPTYILLKDIGEYLIGHAEKIYPRIKKFKEESKIKKIHDITVLDTTDVFDVKDDPTFGSELYCRNFAPKVELIISNDNRGPGLSLYRRRDQRLNLYNLDGEDGVEFAHKNGFLAKVDPKCDINDLIKKAKR